MTSKMGWIVVVSVLVSMVALCEGGCKYLSHGDCIVSCSGRCDRDDDGSKWCCRVGSRPSGCSERADCKDGCRGKVCYDDRTANGYQCWECSGLSVGAIIGIVFGIIAFFVIIGVLICCCCCAMCPFYNRGYPRAVVAEPVPVVAPPPPPMFYDEPVVMVGPAYPPPPPPPPVVVGPIGLYA